MKIFFKLFFAFVAVFIFALFLFSPEKSFAATCANLTGNAYCAISGACRGEGGSLVSGTGCGSGKICCCPAGANCHAPYTPTPTSCPSQCSTDQRCRQISGGDLQYCKNPGCGSSCEECNDNGDCAVISQYGSGYHCTSGNNCVRNTPTPIPTSTPAPASPSCSSRGAYCAPSGVCNAEGTRVTGTGCTGTTTCCCFDPGGCPVRTNNCPDKTRIRTYTNNSSTNWRVSITYHYSDGGVENGTTDSNPDGYFSIPGTYTPQADDWFKWNTACVDPRVNFNSYKMLDRSCSLTISGTTYDEWRFDVDAACHDITDNSNRAVYAGCGQDYTNDFGTVGTSAQCPTNSCYCTNGGYTSYSANCCQTWNTDAAGNKYGRAYCSGSSCGNPPATNTPTPRPATNTPTRTPTPTCNVPSTPSGFGTSSVCNASDQANLTLNWNDSTNSPSGYSIQWGATSGNLNNSGSSSTSTYTIGAASVNNNTTYYYRVRADKACGNSNWSAIQSGATRTCTPPTATPTTPPAQPAAPIVSTSTSCVSGNPRIALDWGAAARATSYDVDYKRDSASTWTVGANNTTNTTYNITNIAENVLYDWRIRSVNSAGNSSYDTGTTRSATCSVAPPNCPSNINASSSCNASNQAYIDVSWSNVSGATSYDLRYKTSAGTTWNPVTGVSSVYRISAASLTNNTLYDYQVRAVNSGGDSGWCPATANTVRTLSCTGPTPTNTRTPTPTPAPVTADIDVNVFDDPAGTCIGNTRIGGSQACIGASCQSVSASNPGAKFSNLAAGTYNINLTPRNNYVLSSCSTNPKSRTIPPDAVANYYIQAQPPTCTSLTTSRATVNPGQNATLTVNGCPAGVDYTWYTPGPGNYSGQSANTVVWNSPNPYSIDTYAYPTVQVCWTGGGACNSYALSNGSATSNPPNQGIHIVPLFSINGMVFVDEDNDGVKDAIENPYNGGITITRNPANGVVSIPGAGGAGTFDITGLSAATYTISYTSLPAGYQMTSPLNGPPPSFSVSVGPDASNINFGITNTTPWIQSEGSDIWFNSGFTNEIPEGASCGGAGPYTSINGASGRPGVVFSGVGSQSHGGGQASANPYNWKVGGTSASDQNNLPPPPPSLKTSYDYVNSKLVNYAGTPVLMENAPGCSRSGNNINCTGNFSTLARGVYKADVPNGTVNLNAAISFPQSSSYVFLINGNLNINNEIHLPAQKNTYASFHTTGDIIVASSVASPSNVSRTANLEGWFSAGKNFTTGTGARLNIEGAVVVNASGNGGTFNQQRDLAGGNAICPSFFVKERPDLILNSPEFIQTTRRIWQEVAP